MLDHIIAKNATAHKVKSYYTLAIFYCTFCVGKHTILGPGLAAALVGGSDSNLNDDVREDRPMERL